MRLTGLQAKMTASYVVVTAAAVLLVEVVAIGLLVPSAVSASDLQARVQSTAGRIATESGNLWTKQGFAPTGPDFPNGAGVADPRPGTAEADDAGGIVVDRTTGGYVRGQAAVPVGLLVDRSGMVLASSYPAQFPVGSRPQLPYDPATDFKNHGTASTDGGQVTWAVLPVLVSTPPVKSSNPAASAQATASPSGHAPVPPGQQVVGSVYVQVASDASVGGTRDIGPSVRIGLLVLLLLLPVGAAFGFLSTRRTVSRVRRLEATTARVAGGDLDQRVDVSGRDELGGLESGFNTMAEQLQESIEAERQLSGSAARADERTRIARELHDSVSQDVFSLSILAGGLRKALPETSILRPEVDAMERTSRRALREMQALLLELRPVAVDDIGLSDALTELCVAYRSRLGIDVRPDIGPLETTVAVEHGVLRVTQEALANAIKHADPTAITVSVQQSDGCVRVKVHDDGVGFDPVHSVDGKSLGLGLESMRQRVAELAGQIAVESVPGGGTTVTVEIPASGER
jgi:signal transduction histidine kinase